MLESTYQARLIKKLRANFPGCVVLKNDTGARQGIPDLSLFHGEHWAWLEVKASADSPEQPNQRYYIELAQELSFGAFIYPENEEEVLYGFQQLSASSRKTRNSLRQ